MHELAITQSILEIILKHAQSNNASRIISVSLKIGELTGMKKEWIIKYFNYISKNTIAEEAQLEIEIIPALLQCQKCKASFPYNSQDIKNNTCPSCHSTEHFSILSGKEYFIQEMKIQ